MVALKFCGAIRGALGQVVRSFHEDKLATIYSLEAIYEWVSTTDSLWSQVIDFTVKSSLGSEVPLPEEKLSWQWDSGFLSPERQKSNQ